VALSRTTYGFLALLAALLLAGCSMDWTDAATRLAADLDSGSRRVGKSDGERATVVHRTPSKEGECMRKYTVQIDEAGAIIIWCYGETGEVVSSHSTSSHNRSVVTPRTFILDKGAGEPLTIELERQGGRVLIADVR
jgi:hypothetical protein